MGHDSNGGASLDRRSPHRHRSIQVAQVDRDTWRVAVEVEGSADDPREVVLLRAADFLDASVMGAAGVGGASRPPAPRDALGLEAIRRSDVSHEPPAAA